MLESVGSLVLCGCVSIDNEVTPIYANVNTGEVCLELPATGDPVLISEISVTDPVQCMDVRALTSSLESLEGAIGIVLRRSGTAIVILSETKAVERSMSNLMSGGEVFDIDMTEDYEVSMIDVD